MPALFGEPKTSTGVTGISKGNLVKQAKSIVGSCLNKTGSVLLKILALEFNIHQKYKMRLFLLLLQNTIYDNSFKTLYLSFLDTRNTPEIQNETISAGIAKYNIW